MKYEITAEMNLTNLIEEAKEVSRALYEFAEELERIGNKYGTETQDKEEQL